MNIKNKVFLACHLKLTVVLARECLHINFSVWNTYSISHFPKLTVSITYSGFVHEKRDYIPYFHTL